MSIFIIRIILHEKDHSHADYAKLHDAMTNAGYSRIITGLDNKRYHLPTAEYTLTATTTADRIVTHVKPIANNIDTNNGVLVTRAEGLQSDYIQWSGLKPV